MRVIGYSTSQGTILCVKHGEQAIATMKRNIIDNAHIDAFLYPHSYRANVDAACDMASEEYKAIFEGSETDSYSTCDIAGCGLIEGETVTTDGVEYELAQRWAHQTIEMYELCDMVSQKIVTRAQVLRICGVLVPDDDMYEMCEIELNDNGYRIISNKE